MCTQQPMQDMLQVLKAYTHTHTLQVCNIGIIGTTLESLEHWNHFLEKCTPRPTPCRSVTARHTDPPKVMMYPHVYKAAKTLRLLHTLPLITQGVERGQGCTLRLRSAPAAPLRSGLSKKYNYLSDVKFPQMSLHFACTGSPSPCISKQVPSVL